MSAYVFRTALSCLLLLAALPGCTPRLDEPVPGVYRATLALPGGEAPFGLEIAQEQRSYVVYLSNGTERTRVSNVQVRDRQLIVVFPGDASTLHATMHRKGLEGSVTLATSGGKEQVIPFKATLGDTWRFYKVAMTDNADVAGRWDMTLTSGDGKPTRIVARFEQQHDHVTGTVMTAGSEPRFLEGQVHGDDIQLSTFADGLASLYKLRVNQAGDLEGDYWQGLTAHEKVAAKRSEDADGEQPSI
jgi:hypothetical protein